MSRKDAHFRHNKALWNREAQGSHIDLLRGPQSPADGTRSIDSIS